MIPILLALAWLAGLYVQHILALPLAARNVLALMGAVGVAYRGRWPRARLVGALLYTFACATGRYQAVQPTLNPRQVAFYAGHGLVTLTGVVTAEPDVRDTSMYLRLRVQYIQVNLRKTYIVDGLVLVAAPRYPEYHYGDQLEVRGLLDVPPASEGFSYREYLARQGIHAWVPFGSIERLATNMGDPWTAALLQAKEHTRTLLTHLWPEPEASVLTGILIGDDNGIPRGIADAFTVTGTSHLVAISGSNFVTMAAALMAIAKRTIKEKWGTPLVILVLAMYAVFVGGSASVVRAFIMSSLVLVAQRFGRQSHALTSLGLASVIMTYLDPDTLWDPGFILSAGATLGLVLYSEPLEKLVRAGLGRVLPGAAVERVVGIIGDGLIVTTAAQITTLPYIVYSFRRLSLITLLVNFLVLPAQPPLMLWGVGAALVGLLYEPAGQLVGTVAWLYMAYTLRVIEALAAVPLAQVSFDWVSPEWTCGYYVVLFGVTALPATWRERLKAHFKLSTVLGALVVANLLLWSAVPLLPDGRLHVTILNVEDGSAVLIVTPTGRRILVDGGPRPTTTLSLLGRRFAPWDKRLDVVLLTNPKAARLNGLLDVLERYEVGYVLTNGVGTGADWAALVEVLVRRGIRHSQVVAGQRVQTGDGLQLELLNAWEGGTESGGEAPAFADEQSVVVRGVYGGHSFMLMSDVTEQGEVALIARGQARAADILVVGRNGAREATGVAWLAVVRPSVVVVSVRPDARVVLPAPEVLARVAAAGAVVWRTDEGGAVEWVVGAEGVWRR